MHFERRNTFVLLICQFKIFWAQHIFGGRKELEGAYHRMTPATTGLCCVLCMFVLQETVYVKYTKCQATNACRKKPFVSQFVFHFSDKANTKFPNSFTKQQWSKRHCHD